MTLPRLIEVALPIREISAESVRDKSLRHGHISTLHLWWARRPLSASRAIVFASLVPDPDHPDCPADFRDAVLKYLRDEVPAELKAYRRGKLHINSDPYKPYDDIPDTARNRLLTFIAKWSPEWLEFEKGKTTKQPKPFEMLDDRSLVKWDTSNPENEQGRIVLDIARKLIRIANRGETPTLLDPFSGGGAIPLEATRLGLQAIANDYSPVAHLILRATTEFPQKFGKPGKRMVEREEYGQIKREEVEVVNVLAYDVEYWANKIYELTRQQVGFLYPSGKDVMPVITYTWARTIPCSNPSCRAEIPLLRSLLLCEKPGKRIALTMKVKGKEIQFDIVRNAAIQTTDGMMIKGGACRCPVCQQKTPVEDIRRYGQEGKIKERMIAVVVDTPNGKDYRLVEPSDLKAYEESHRISQDMEFPTEYIVPEINAPNAPKDAGSHRSISIDLYGYKTFGSLLNSRHLVVLSSFLENLHEILSTIDSQIGDKEYRNAVATYLGLWISRIAQRMNTVGLWNTQGEKIEHPFGRQSIPMVSDYPEAVPFAHASGGAIGQLDWVLRYILHEGVAQDSDIKPAKVSCGDSAHLPLEDNSVDVVVTDPPYFDAIAYADLSDFFYVWLKRALQDVFPETFATPQTPKSEEAVAHKHRHHGKKADGKLHFQRKLAECFSDSKRVLKNDGVFSVMFAHQDTEAWSALVNALFEAGLNITATYPIDTERINALKRDISALASSITVVCRPRTVGAASSFRDVRREVEQTVAESVHRYWGYGFRGADLIVACYGPAVGVFGRHSRVERADGTPVTVPELLDLARESALKAIAGEFTGDPLSRLYFIWANLYGISEQSWDDVRLVVQIGGESENAMEVARGRGLFVVDGSSCRLALLHDRVSRKHLGDESDTPLIDQLHHAMQLWKEEKRGDLVNYLRENELLDQVPYWKLAQALFEVLPRDEEDWKLISSLLGERETLRLEAKRSEQPKQQSMFDS
jgi:putative DNA methylase